MNESPKKKVLLSWSSGKDSAWALHVLRQEARFDVVGLLTTVNKTHQRVAMHAVREALLHTQSRAAGLPLRTVPLPHPCTNEVYESCMGSALAEAKTEGIEGIAFGDLFLEDVRHYRERQVEPLGLEAHFPIWGLDTHALAETIVQSGGRAVLTCVNPKQCPREFAGRTYDDELLKDLPPTVDPCGEKGEFHTFAYAGPMFHSDISFSRGQIVEREGFVFADLLPGDVIPEGEEP